MDDFNNSSRTVNPEPFRESPRRRTRWWIPLLIIVGVLVLFFIAVISFFGYVVTSLERAPVVVSKNSILKLDLSNVEEYSEINPFYFFTNQSQNASFLDILNAVKSAKDDDRIKGIYYECVSGLSIEPAKAAELQEALLDFKKSGKFIYSYIEAASEDDYFNALPSDSIFVSSEAVLEFNGFGATAIFPKGLYEKIGLDYTVIQCEDFKSAGEQYYRKGFSDSARYQTKLLIEQKENKFVEAVSKYRNLTKDEVYKNFSKGLLSSRSMIESKLVDVIMSKSEIKQFLHLKACGEAHQKESEHSMQAIDDENCACDYNDYNYTGEDPIFISINNYVTSLKQTQISESKIDKNNSIAIIYGSGPIVSKDIKGLPFVAQENMIIAEDFIQYLKEARENDDIKAIILRLDTPGGSVIASELIYQEIMQTKKIKPVYASMSDVAASGGYYISMACDTIIAHPETITGSIGVIVSIPNFSGVINKLGMSVDTISTGNGSPFFLNPLLPKNSNDTELMKQHAFDTYFRFLDKAALSRNKTVEDMRKLAKGRVWSGEDAHKNGLVDVLGGLNDAITLVKKRLNVPEDKKIKVYVFPNEQTKWTGIIRYFTDSKMSYSSNSKLNEYFEASELLSIPHEVTKQIKYSFILSKLFTQEKTLLALPYYQHIR